MEDAGIQLSSQLAVGGCVRSKYPHIRYCMVHIFKLDTKIRNIFLTSVCCAALQQTRRLPPKKQNERVVKRALPDFTVMNNVQTH